MQYINLEDARILFSKSFLLAFIKIVFFIVLFLGGLYLFIFSELQQETNDYYQKLVNKSKSISTTCLKINCEYILTPHDVVAINVGNATKFIRYYDYYTLKVEKGKIIKKHIKTSTLPNMLKRGVFNMYGIQLTETYKYVITNFKTGNTFIINNSYLFETVNKIFFYLTLSIGLIFIALTIILFYYYSKHKKYEEIQQKNYIENKAQANISEMINHEINTPLAILKTSLKNISKAKATEEQIKGIKYALESLDAVVELLNNNKLIRYSGKNITIKELIIQNIKNINRSNIGKLKLNFVNDIKLLEEKAVNPKLGNGNLLNLIHILFNNALEAGANEINISCFYSGNESAIINIKDNGRGIRDCNGSILNPKKALNIITQYGYSTKSVKNKKQYWFEKLLRLFKIIVYETKTGRGVGLYVCKIMLEKNNGKLSIIDTSETGTEFSITLPVVNIETSK